jgi:hypothetical protein
MENLDFSEVCDLIHEEYGKSKVIKAATQLNDYSWVAWGYSIVNGEIIAYLAWHIAPYEKNPKEWAVDELPVRRSRGAF